MDTPALQCKYCGRFFSPEYFAEDQNMPITWGEYLKTATCDECASQIDTAASEYQVLKFDRKEKKHKLFQRTLFE